MQHPAVTVKRCNRRNRETGILENRAHSIRLLFPVILVIIILNDTQRIYSQVLYAELPSQLNCILEGLRQLFDLDRLLKLWQIVLRECDTV